MSTGLNNNSHNNNNNSSNSNNSNNSYRSSSYNSGYANTSNTGNTSTTSTNSTNNASNNGKPYSNSNTNRSYGYSNNTTSYNPTGVNNSFDRWSSSNITGGNSSFESIELLKDQLSHQQRDYESLKQRFNELSRMRFSEPEEQLEEHKKLSELRDQEAQRAIKSLQKEKDQLLDQIKQLKLEVTESKSLTTNNKSDRNVEQDEHEDFMNEIEKILKIYSSFSGLKITPTPTDPLHQWHCEFSSRSGHFEFQLTYESALNRYQYVPLSSGSIKDLPPFLSSDILITFDQMQLFFWRLLDTLSKRKE